MGCDCHCDHQHLHPTKFVFCGRSFLTLNKRPAGDGSLLAKCRLDILVRQRIDGQECPSYKNVAAAGEVFTASRPEYFPRDPGSYLAWPLRWRPAIVLRQIAQRTAYAARQS